MSVRYSISIDRYHSHMIKVELELVFLGCDRSIHIVLFEAGWFVLS